MRVLFQLVFLLGSLTSFAQATFLRTYPEINYPIEHPYPRKASVQNLKMIERTEAYYGILDTDVHRDGIRDTAKVQIVKFEKITGNIIKQRIIEPDYCGLYLANYIFDNDKIYLFLYSVSLTLYCGPNLVDGVDRTREDYLKLVVLDTNLNILSSKQLRKGQLEVKHVETTQNGIELLGTNNNNFSYFKYKIDSEGKELSYREYYPRFWNYSIFYDFQVKDDEYYINTADTLFVTDTAYQIKKLVKLGTSNGYGRLQIENDKLYYYSTASKPEIGTYTFIETYDKDLNRIDSTNLYLDKYSFNICIDGDFVLLPYSSSVSHQKYLIYKSPLNSSSDLVFTKEYVGFNFISSIIKVSDGGYLFRATSKDDSTGLSLFNLVKTDCMGNIEWRAGDCSLARSPKFELYPNPVNETIAIHFSFYSETQKIELKIYDILGREICNFKEPYQKSIYLNLEHLNFGIYFYQLFLDGKPVGKGKFLKE
jgi:hypothetical protein